MEAKITIYFHQSDIPKEFVFHQNPTHPIAIDCETMGLKLLRDRLCMLQFSDGVDAHLVNFSQDKYDAPNLKKLLSEASRPKIFHFARFDVAAIYHYLGVELSNVYCTKIASKLVRTYTDSHGLKDVCAELAGVKISKQQQSSDWGNSKITKEQEIYAAQDVLYLHQVKEKLDMMLQREGRTLLAADICAFIPTLAKLDLNGWDELIFNHH